MHEQQVFRRMGLFENDRCPVAERLGRRVFYVPSELALKKQQIAQIAVAIAEVFSNPAA
jgi:perosamine synthetase